MIVGLLHFGEMIGGWGFTLVMLLLNLIVQLDYCFGFDMIGGLLLWDFRI